MASWDRSANFTVYLSINYIVIYHSYQKKQDEDMSVNQTKAQYQRKQFLRRNAFGNPKNSMEFIVNRAHISQQ